MFVTVFARMSLVVFTVVFVAVIMEVIKNVNVRFDVDPIGSQHARSICI